MVPGSLQKRPRGGLGERWRLNHELVLIMVDASVRIEVDI